MGLGFIKQKGKTKTFTDEEIQNMLLEFKLLKKKPTQKDSSLGLPNNAFNIFEWLLQALELLGLLPLPTTTPLTQLQLNNCVFVSKNGDDSTGARERLDLPFLTVSAALASANSGDTIIIYPGNYTTNDLVQNGKRIYAFPGTVLRFEGTTLDFTKSGIYGNGDIIFNPSSQVITIGNVFIEGNSLSITGEVTFSAYTRLHIKVNNATANSTPLIHIASPSLSSSSNIEINIATGQYSNNLTPLIDISGLNGGQVKINVNSIIVNRLTAEGAIHSTDNFSNSCISINVNKIRYTSPSNATEAEYPLVTSTYSCNAEKDYKILGIETYGKLYETFVVLTTTEIEKGYMKFSGQILDYIGKSISSHINFTKPYQAIKFDLDISDFTAADNVFLNVSDAFSQTVTGRIVGNPNGGTRGIIEYDATKNQATLENLTVISSLKPSFRNTAIGANGLNVKSAYTNTALSLDNGGVTTNYGTIIVNSNIV